MTAVLIALLLAALEEPPEAMQLARRAYEQVRAGQLAGAVASLQQAARLAPSNPLYRSALGGIYEQQGKLEEAVAAFAEAYRLDQSNAQIRERLERLSLDWGAQLARDRRYRAGLALARETASRFPDSPAAALMLGLFLTRNQQNLAAVDAYRRALALDPQSADASLGLAIAQSSAGLTKDAQLTFEAGLKAFPNDAMHRQAFGVFLVKLAETGDTGAPARARTMLESALALDPSLAEAHFQLAGLALAEDEPARAWSHLEQAASNGLDDSRLHYSAARILRRLGRDRDADARLELFRQRKARETQ